VAAHRETLNQFRTQLEAAQAEQATAAIAWQNAAQQAALAEGKAAAAQRSLSELKALASYQSAQEAAQANEASQTQALERLAAAIATAKTPSAIDPAMATVNNDLAGAQVVLASVRTRLSEQEQLAQQLAEAVAAVETAEASRAAALGAVDEAYAKLQSSSSERCLSAGITQLSPEQIAWSTWQALGVLDLQRAAAGAEWDAAHPAEGATETTEQRATARAAFVEQKVYDNLQGSLATFVNLFGGAPGQPQQVFQATADQALFFANSGELRSWLAPGGGNLTERLVALTDDQAFAEELYLAVFTRAPSAEEIEMVRTYLAGRQQDRAAAVQEIVWALVTSSEFRFGT
jgi:DNA repair exonuclease SbcCD ATPase subunit